jgi:hypothetical protein
MTWLAVDTDGQVLISENKPSRYFSQISGDSYWTVVGKNIRYDSNAKILLSVLSKTELNWEDEPVEFVEVKE